mmetsp:Transcript_623/g.1411  ORF Transcript_623/g.1411 Transcript_623/m.1411 type:complete len:87 (+) Transcript_623:71-331(+)
MLGSPPKLGVLLLAIFVALVVNKLSSFDGSLHDGNRPIPLEAVPMYKQAEMHWFCRFVFGYIFATSCLLEQWSPALPRSILTTRMM